MRFALVAAGGMGKSLVPGLPRLSEQLGPVAAASTRLASRLANTLRAGFPVKSMDDLDASAAILLCLGGKTAPTILGELGRAKISWERKILLLCDSNLSSDAIRDFRIRGAATGSIDRLGDLSGRFAIEGDPPAVRLAKQLIQELKGKPVELQRGKALIYGAALTFSSSLFTPLIEGCVECLHDAGVPGALARQIAESLFQKSLRDYMHAGRRGWFGSLALGNPGMMEKEIEGLRKSKLLLADYYRMSAIFALEFYKHDPDLARRLRASI